MYLFTLVVCREKKTKLMLEEWDYMFTCHRVLTRMNITAGREVSKSLRRRTAHSKATSTAGYYIVGF